jgi:NAD(P)-dependent dehydrogenase (short-subunit alcohol dehydrogenase family)
MENNENKTQLILVAGATGNLGQRICRELMKRNAQVRAVVRSGSDPEKTSILEKMGIEVLQVDLSNQAELQASCAGVSCVVSALAGLKDAIIDTQTQLLDAAVAAGVPRFIPSDFSSDFTQIPAGENRNFDLRKEFGAYLDQSPIRATSIFNGCFADILRYNTPLFNVPEKTVAYWGEKTDWQIDFTTMDDTAAFTSLAAMDDSAPRSLSIASFSVSPNDLIALGEKHKGSTFKLVDMGSMADFSAYNRMQRAANPAGENELYPKWQQSQYLYSMFVSHHESLDNDRYAGLSWSGVEACI